MNVRWIDMGVCLFFRVVPPFLWLLKRSQKAATLLFFFGGRSGGPPKKKTHCFAKTPTPSRQNPPPFHKPEETSSLRGPTFSLEPPALRFATPNVPNIRALGSGGCRRSLLLVLQGVAGDLDGQNPLCETRTICYLPHGV